MYLQIIRICSRENYLYGLPKEVSVVGLKVNKPLFERLNIPLPSKEWNWDDFYNIALQFSRDINSDGINDIYLYKASSTNRIIFSLLQSWGKDFVDINKKQCYFNTEEFISMINYLKNLIDRNLILIGNAGTNITNDNIGMTESLVSFITESVYGEDFIYLNYPMNKAGYCYKAESAKLCINKKSSNKLLAAKFLGIYASREVSKNFFSDGFYKDKSIYVKPDDKVRGSKFIDSEQLDDVYEFILDNAKEWTFTTDMNKVVTDGINEFLSGKINARESAESIQKKIEMMLKE